MTSSNIYTVISSHNYYKLSSYYLKTRFILTTYPISPTTGQGFYLDIIINIIQISIQWILNCSKSKDLKRICRFSTRSMSRWIILDRLSNSVFFCLFYFCSYFFSIIQFQIKNLLKSLSRPKTKTPYKGANVMQI